jgi:hypothetical protein
VASAVLNLMDSGLVELLDEKSGLMQPPGFNSAKPSTAWP